jgi:hypothetical protein
VHNPYQQIHHAPAADANRVPAAMIDPLQQGY